MPIAAIAAIALGGLAMMATAALSTTSAGKSLGKASMGLLGKLMPDPKKVLLGAAAAGMVMKYLYTSAQVSMTALGANVSERFKGLFPKAEAPVYKSKDIIISGAAAMGTTIAEAAKIEAEIAGMPTQAEAQPHRGITKPTTTEAGVLAKAALAATTITGGLSGSRDNTGEKSISGQNSKTKEKEVAATPDVIAGNESIASDAPVARDESVGRTGDISERAPVSTDSTSVLDPTRRDAKTQVKEKAKELANTSKKNEDTDKRAFTTCCDLKTNKCYDGISGYLPSNSTRNSQPDKTLSALIKEKEKELAEEGFYNQAGKLNLEPTRKGGLDQCAEYNAINNALNDGSKLGPHLLVYTVDAKGNKKDPCLNCQFLFHGKVKFVDFNPRTIVAIKRKAEEKMKEFVSNSEKP